MKVRLIKYDEYPRLTQIHVKAFEGFFLTTLGVGFLNTYYKSCLKSKEIIAVCITDEFDVIQGFGIGCTHSSGFHKRLVLRNIFSFMLQGIVIFFTRFSAIFRLLKNMEKNADVKDDGNYAELLSIAVLPELKGIGAGKLLIAKFEEEALKKGCRLITLTTDFHKNDDVISFYLKSGYEIFYKFTTYPKREMYKLIKDL